MHGSGRYDDGLHVECAGGGYNCNPGDPLVIHDDTVSPWTGPGQASFGTVLGAIFTGNFWTHGFVDLIYGSWAIYAFPD